MNMRKKYRIKIARLENDVKWCLKRIESLEKEEINRDLKITNQNNLSEKKKLIGKEVDTFISLGCLGLSMRESGKLLGVEIAESGKYEVFLDGIGSRECYEVHLHKEDETTS